MLKTCSVSCLALAVAMSMAGGIGSTAAQAAETGAAGSAAAGDDAEGPGGQNADPSSEIIVTGTRASGIAASESAAPIKIVGSESMEHVGQPSLSQVLNQLVPSFNAQQFGNGAAGMSLTAALRGLSPNQTLILVNGKRRHGTANFQLLPSGYQGAVAPDLDFIPKSGIKRIEVLEDGAAAQYGSDAISGVINIILDDAAEGGSFEATAGQYFKGDGLKYAASLNVGTRLGENGFLNLNGFYRKQEHSANGGLDTRISNPDGTLRASLTPAQQAAYVTLPDYPYVSRYSFGDPRSEVAVVSYNAGYDFGGVELYSFGTYGHRNAAARQVVRPQDTTIASPVLGVRGTFTTPGELIFAPNGYTPEQAIREDDYGATIGLKGDANGWRWDLSSTYGQDTVRIYNNKSANNALFVDTHFTPTSFYIGLNKSTEWTSNLDISKEIDAGLSAPINFAFGGEYRKNTYDIGAGDPASYYKEGAQSLPGLTPGDAGHYSRNNVAAYVDVALQPVEALKLDAAARYEHYSDFGSNLSAKLTGRYDFSPAFALRGTFATGFRAPALAEQYFSTTSASPTRVAVQISANSDAAKLLGFQDLKPEKSTNLSFGAVIRPADRVTITIDAYQISIKDRILITGNIFGRGGRQNSQAVLDAIAARGVAFDPTVPSISVTTLTNGMDTRTRGVDVTASYRMPTDNAGTFNWTLLANLNDKKIQQVDPTPAPISNQALFDLRARGLVTTAAPKVKIIGGLDWNLGKFNAMLRETYFGAAYVYNSPNNGDYVKNEVKATFITDIELGLDLNDNLSFAVGANNLFNKKPEGTRIEPVTGQLSVGGQTVWNYPLPHSPYGINGGYYYGRVTLTW